MLREGMVAVSLKETIYLLIVACLTLSINLFAISISQQTYWIIWSALILSSLCLQQHFKFHIYQVLLTGLISALLVWLQATYFRELPWLPIFLGCTTLLTIFYGQRYPEWFLPTLIINVFALLSALYPVTNNGIYIDKYLLPDNINRALWIVCGTLIIWLPQVMLWQVLFWRSQKIIYAEFNATLVATLNIFCGLNKIIFSCFLQPEYQENIYLFERRMHVQKNRIVESIVLLRKLSKLNSMANNINFAHIINQLDLLFDLMLDYAQLRRRVTDNTIFSVCFTELTAICNEIDKLLADMTATFPNKTIHLSTQGLLEKINRFEEVYINVLQVTSREPLVFLLFITSLKDFCNELAVFYETLLAIRGKS